MAGSVNKVILVGNLGADPEIRRTQDGRPVANLRVATSDSWRDKATGERRERTEWHRVVIFNEGLCRIAEQYLKKGAKVYLEGQLQTRKWQDPQGQDRYSTEVVLQGFNSQLTMLDRAGAGGAGQPGPMPASPAISARRDRPRRASASRRWRAPSATTSTTRFRSEVPSIVSRTSERSERRSGTQERLREASTVLADPHKVASRTNAGPRIMRRRFAPRGPGNVIARA